MARYYYRVLNKEQEQQTGQLEASDVASASAELHRRGWVPLEVSEGTKSLAMRLNEPVNLFNMPTRRDTFGFLRDMARLLRAGLSMDDAIVLLIDMNNKELFKRVLQNLRERVRRGESLSNAMSQHRDIFSVQVIASVQSGEISGTLPSALETISQALDRTLSFQERLRSALVYPAILMIMVCSTFVLVMTFVLPQFAPIFDGNEENLPWATIVVMQMAGFFSDYIWFVGLALLLFIGWLLAVWYHVQTKARLLKAACHIPAIRQWLLPPDIVRFVRTLGVCSSSGLALDKAIAMAVEAVKTPHLLDDLGRLRTLVRRGEVLSVSMASLGWIPSVVLQFARVGEQSGNLGALLEEAATIVAQDYEAKLEKSLELLSPILTLLMGGIVAMLVGSVLLGIMSINNVAL